ncbi:hypothetical protein [Actinomadura violacea]|uniref:Scaffolding protein n=1 Tax=Actinomadura violacea TaxID=2819934 RepID=A0ABS3RWN5_9ACTN|nr:hypothetical protein [Actinomadura violacea]MBO2461174.1 hypothetical protein [Actinomadura violacea]
MNTTKATPALNLPDVSTLPIHDRTGLRAIGVLPSGRIVWPVMGGADDDTDDQDGGQDDRDTGGGQGGGSGAGQDDDDDGNGQDDDTDNDDGGDGGDGKAGKDKPRRTRDRRARAGDDKTERTIAAIRDDFKDERSKRQAAEKATAALQKQLDDMQATQTKQMDALAKALGLKKDDTPPSPEEVAKNLGSKLQAAEAETETERKRADTAHANYREAAVQLAVYLAADDHDANPRALLDSARFLKSVAGLDPDADDFSSKIADAIDTAVEKNERLRKAKPRAAERSGGEMNTGNKPQRKRPASLNEAVKKHYDQAR